MRRLLAILLFSLLLLPLQATFEGQYYSADIAEAYYLGIPHFEDELPARSSLSFAASVGLFGYTQNNWDASMEVHLFSVTDSLPFGFYQARGFNSIGANFRGAYAVNPRLSVFSSLGTEVNFYHDIEEVFASFSFQVGPQLLIYENTDSRILLTFPISLHLRKEITGVQAGIGIRYQLYPTKTGGTP
ncbi:MAG: hypothetical protein AB7C91_09815 [Sphaerochaeta sp.]|uniref:hypothetical protein n=1 Tax=Sphaerochaeta sp. TaxID=1972642 RepID=UPI003D13305E